MKFTFITTADNLTGISVRTLSSFLRGLGHETRLVFVAASRLQGSNSEKMIEQITRLCKDSDVVGISVFTIDYYFASRVTDAIHSDTSAKVMWGGIHATVRPKESLEHADYACVGEGESVLEALGSGKNPKDIRGLWHKDNGAVIENGVAEMVKDLNALPHQDFSFEDHHVVNGESGEAFYLTQEYYQKQCGNSYHDLNGEYKPFYMTMSSRGCPFSCTYCSNNVYHDMYTIKHYRMAPVTHLIDDLEKVTKQNPFIGIIYLIDDSFFSRSIKDLEEFAAFYKKKIGLPFNAVAYPSTIKKEKLELLIDAGLCRISMGIQSGSKETLKRYKRPGSKETIYKAAKLLSEYEGKILPPKYDIISSDRFQSIDEQRESVKFLSTIPGTFANHSLLLFPGTTLHKMAVEDDGSVDLAAEGYTGYHSNPEKYYDILILFLNVSIVPKWLVRVMAQNVFYRLGEKSPLFKKALLRLVSGLQSLDHYIEILKGKLTKPKEIKA